MDALDQKLNEHFDGSCCARTCCTASRRAPTSPPSCWSLLLAKFCASNDEAEIRPAWRPCSTRCRRTTSAPTKLTAQSKVATRGSTASSTRYTRYVEKEKRHWAALENFGSQRIAIAEKYYRDNDRLLEGGIWAEVTLAFNEIEDDDYAFYVEDLRPVQLARFDFEQYAEGRKAFTRDEWLQTILRSVGLEPTKLDKRVQFHYIARLAPLVESNYNYIELGPRGTGKSYFFSEFSPYATLHLGRAGDQGDALLQQRPPEGGARGVLGHRGLRRGRRHQGQGPRHHPDHEGLHGQRPLLWGRSDRRCQPEFVGNIDLSVEQIVNSSQYDLFHRCRPS